MKIKEIRLLIVSVAYLAFSGYLLYSGELFYYLNKKLSILLIIACVSLIILVLLAYRDKAPAMSDLAFVVLLIPLLFGMFIEPTNIELDLVKPTVITKTSTLNEQGVDEEMEQQLKYQSDLIEINDSNFADAMYELYRFPVDYSGKQITVEGLLFEEQISEDESLLFIGRVFIWHCFADSRVIGLELDYEEDIEINETGWYSAAGVLSYEDDILFLDVENLEQKYYEGNAYVS